MPGKAEGAQAQPSGAGNSIIEMCKDYDSSQITKTDDLSHHWPQQVCVEGKC